MQFEDQNDGEGQNIEEMLGDLVIEDQANTFQPYKNDSTMFIVDCSPDMLVPLDGQEESQLQKIFKGYANFMMSKIIANSSDKVGLILCNVKKSANSLNFDYINTVHSLSAPSAQNIKAASTLFKDFNTRFGISETKSSLHQAFWLYNHEMKDLDSTKYHLRVFLFTSEDCPHQVGEDKRDQAINHARQLAEKNVLIELFPVRKVKSSVFDVKKFYQQILSFDPEDINESLFQDSSKILDLQSRLRQKQFKKRTLNRLTMKIGIDAQIGVKIYSMYNKAKKPLAKKVDARTNKPLQRVTKKVNSSGQILFEGQIGSYYPLGGEKVRLSKEDMSKIKNLEDPGITLMGFKPRSYIKPYHNLRTSYFLYPDEEHITGSSQFSDALITQLVKKNMVAIVKIVPRANQELRFAALLPQQQSFDDEDHFQTPPGFHMIFLPFAEDIAGLSGQKVQIEPTFVSNELVQVTKLLINNLTIHDFDFRNFQNHPLQKFYSHLQAHALQENEVQETRDLLQPDEEGMKKFQDVISLLKESAETDLNYKYKKQEEDNPKSKKQKKQKKQDQEEPTKKSKVDKNDKKEVKKQPKTQQNTDEGVVGYVQKQIMDGQLKGLKVTDLRDYLKHFDLQTTGKKEDLIDRIITFMTHKNQI